MSSLSTLDSDRDEEVRSRARTLSRSHRFEEALPLWTELLDRSPQEFEAKFHVATAQLWLGRTAVARPLILDMLQSQPRQPDVRALAAHLAGHEGDWASAIEHWRVVRMADPTSLAYLIEYGRALFEAGKLDQSRKELYAALARDESSLDARKWLRRCLEGMGLLDEAVDLWREAIRLDPRCRESWLELAHFHGLGDERGQLLDEIRAHFLEDRGGSPGFWIQTALELGFVNLAEEIYNARVANSADDHEAHALTGAIAFAKGDLSRAVSCFRAAERSRPNCCATELDELKRILRILGLSEEELLGGREVHLMDAVFDEIARRAGERLSTRAAVPGRVVFLTPSLAMGGAERQLVTAIRSLLRNYSDRIEGITLICEHLELPGADFFLRDLDDARIEVRSLDRELPPGVAPEEDLDLLGLLPISERFSACRYLEEFLNLRPAVVNGWNLRTAGAAAAALAGVRRIVLSEQSMGPEAMTDDAAFKDYLRSAISGLLKVPGLTLTCNSRAGQADWAEWLGVPEERIGVLLNAIEPQLLVTPTKTGPTPRELLDIPEGVPIVGGVFRMSKEKRPLLWLDVAEAVAAQVDNVCFVLVGDGPLMAAVRRRIVELGLEEKCFCVGLQESVFPWFESMHVQLLVSSYEGLPNALIEGQFAGVPVVSCAVGGVSEAIEPGVTGYLVASDDPADIAAKVVEVLSEAEWTTTARDECSDLARQRFSTVRLADDIVELLELRQPAPRTFLAAAIRFFNRSFGKIRLRDPASYSQGPSTRGQVSGWR